MKLRISLLSTFLILMCACSMFPSSKGNNNPQLETSIIQSNQLETMTPGNPDSIAVLSATPAEIMGTPIPEWEEIPIMPGAIEGKPAGFGYLYSVNIPIEEAETFYLDQFSNRGWTTTSNLKSDTSIFGGPSTILFFERDNEIYQIILIYFTDQNQTIVNMTKTEN